jgi:hypothetical protein
LRSLGRNARSLPGASAGYASTDEALTKLLTAAKLVAMAKEHCKKHPDVELVTVTYCPACRGGAGGKLAAQNMSAKARSERARKAAIASHANRGKGKG